MNHETFQNAAGETFISNAPSSFDATGVFGINQHLTRDQTGYVYWKGVYLDHVSFCPYGRVPLRIYECVEKIVQTCLTLEASGIPVDCESYFNA